MTRSFIFLTILFNMLASALTGQCFLTVSSAADSGPGSLREAILDANACAGQPTIIFTLAVTDTIFLNSNLPELNHPHLVIDGTTAQGYAYPDSMVTINWAGRDDCFDQYKLNVLIKGLAFTNDFSGSGEAAIRAWGGTGLRVQYCKAFNQNKKLVTVQGGNDVRIKFCTAYNFSNDGGAGVFTVNGGNINFIQYCNIYDIPRKILEINSTNGTVTTFRDNIMTNIGYEDNSSAGGKGAHAIQVNNQPIRLVVRNNLVDGLKSKFIELNRGSNLQERRDSIFYNKILNCTGQHVVVINGKASSYPYVGYNYFDGDGGIYGMDQVIEFYYAQAGRIQGNVIKNYKARAIMFRDSDGTVIRENIMHNLSNGPAIELNDDCDNINIRGNIIGTDSLNTPGLSLSTSPAIDLNDCDDCLIGGDITLNKGNQVIAGTNRAIRVSSNSTGVVIQGNDINVSSDGLKCLTTSTDHAIEVESPAAIIGGDVNALGNRIAGKATGIILESNGSTVEGNLIGCTAFGSPVEGSTLERGIYIDKNNCTIGSTTSPALRNKIGYCQTAVWNAGKNNILWSGNEYWNNTATRVLRNDGGSANGGIAPPVITTALPSGTAEGSALPDARVEVYHWDPDTPAQGYEYLGHAMADGSGNWSFTAEGPFANELAAIQILGNNGSEFTSYNGLGILTPLAGDDLSEGNVPGSPVALNILANDLMAGGSPADPALVTLDIDPVTPGDQDELIIAGKGVWTLDISTGDLLFSPETGFTSDPGILSYRLTETATGHFDEAVVIVDYDEEPPLATDDESLNNAAGNNAVLNILSNDLLSDGSAAIPALVTVDIDPLIVGAQSELEVVGQGKWSYDEQTGLLTYDPYAGITLNPDPIHYKLTEKHTNMSADALVTVTYLILPPEANDDESLGNYFGAQASISILENDYLVDGSVASPSTVTIDLDLSSPGNQSSVEVPGEGLWVYNTIAGLLTFIPESGTYNDQAVITYKLTENGTGLSDVALVTMGYVAGENMDPPLNLQAGVLNYNDVLLTWDPPFTTAGDELNWDDGINYEGIGLTAGGTFSVAARWVPEQLGSYEGLALTHIRFFPRGNEAYGITLKAWTGEDASVLVMTQTVNDLVPDQWNTVQLNDPVPLDITQELWVGYTVTDQSIGAYPAGCDNGPAQKGFGDLISLDGSSWTSLKDLGFDFNWNIRAVVGETDGDQTIPALAGEKQSSFPNISTQLSRSYKQPPAAAKGKDLPVITGYNILRDEEFLSAVPANANSYLDIALPDGTYEYKVITVFDLGVSLPSEPATAAVPGGQGPVILLDPMIFGETHPDPPQVTTLSMTIDNAGSAMLDFGIEITPAEGEKETATTTSGDCGYSPVAAPVAGTASPWDAVKLSPPSYSPAAKEQTVIRYDNGQNYGAIGLDTADSFEAAIYFPASTMVNYAGMYLTHVEVFLFQAPYGFRVKIYGPGSSTEPGDPIYVQEVAIPPVAPQWSTIPLGAVIPITGEDLWISYEITQDAGGQYPAGYDYGPAVAGFGDMNYLNGVWTSMTAYGFSLNWNLAGILSDASGNISWLGTLPAGGSVSPGESMEIAVTFDSETLPLGIHEALLKFHSNDPLNPVVEVPVSLNVGAVVLTPPADLEASVTDNDVSLAWVAPEDYSAEDLLGYRVYRDGNFIGQTEETAYLDENLISGTYEYHVTALYDFGESDPSNTAQAVILPSASDPHILTNPVAIYEPHYNPPEITVADLVITNAGEIDLAYSIEVIIDSKKMKLSAIAPPESAVKKEPGTVNGNVLIEGKNKPGGASAYVPDEVVLRYDNGVNLNGLGLAGTGTIEAAAYFPESTMAQYAGEFLEKVEFYINDMPIECNVKVYGQGTPTSPGALLHEQAVTVIPHEWNLVSLWPPLELNGDDLWIGYEALHNGGTSPAGVDAGPAVSGYGDWVRIDGQEWETLGLFGIDKNWNLAGHVTGEPYIEWMMADSLTGTLGQDESATITITFNSDYVSAGLHEGSIVITSNDPLNSVVSIPVTLDVGGTGLVPPENLEGSLYVNDVHLEWDAPGGDPGEWIQWDEGVNNGNGVGMNNGGTFHTASRWLPADLEPYDGQFLTAISFFPNGDPGAEYTLEVWTGEDAGTLVISQEVGAFAVDEWNDVELENAVLIDAQDELWFGYMVSHLPGTSPAGTDDGPAVSGKGDMISTNGLSWQAMGTSYGLDYNWNLAGWVSPGDKGKAQAGPMIPETDNSQDTGEGMAFMRSKTNGVNVKTFSPGNKMSQLLGYNVYRNDENIGYVGVPAKEYDDFDLLPGYYEYYVTAVYAEGESVPSNTWADLITTIGSGQARERTFLFPNPAGEKVTIVSEFAIRKVDVFDCFGQPVKSEMVDVNQHVLQVNDLASGVYLVHIHTGVGNVTLRMIKL